MLLSIAMMHFEILILKTIQAKNVINKLYLYILKNKNEFETGSWR